MKQSTTTTDSRVWFKLILILLVLLALPEYVQFGQAGFMYWSVLFDVGSYVGIMQFPSTGPVLVTPQLIILALILSLPGMFFFVRIHGANRTGPIRGLMIACIVTTFVLGAFVLSLWPAFIPMSFVEYYFFAEVANAYPVYALVALVLVPFFLRESSFLLPISMEAGVNEVSKIQPGRTASARVAYSIGLLVAIVTLIVPTLVAFGGSQYVRPTVLSGVTISLQFTVYTNIGEAGLLLYSQTYYMVSTLFSFGALLVLSLLRVVFARNLIRYYRGIGRVGRLLATGVIGEAMLFSPYILASVYYMTVLPLPFLFVLGVLLVPLRDKLTSRGVMITPRRETSGVKVWPLTVEEEGPMTRVKQAPRRESVKVPVIYMILSRIRDHRRHTRE